MKHVEKPRLLAALVMLFAINQFAVAQFNNKHKFYIDLGFIGGAQLPQSGVVGVFGGLGFNFNFFNRPSSIDIRAKEMYAYKPTDQQATLITATYRIPIIKGLFVGIGGAHGHQIMSEYFLNDPASSVMGSNEHIMHATGFNSEIGYSFASLIKNKGVGIYPHAEISYTQTGGHHQKFKHLSINAGFKIAFKKLSS